MTQVVQVCTGWTVRAGWLVKVVYGMRSDVDWQMYRWRTGAEGMSRTAKYVWRH